jgi:5S rRNA maturation endonuclease (ribonuclease M5)
MFGRAVVPIYDTEGRYIVGCSGRSLYEKCKFCEGYHDPNRMCPSKDFVRFYSKWKHSVDYPASKTFYNYHNALEYIRKTHKVILVEGLGHVWKLHEAGHYNAIANFGLYFNDFKKSLLDNTGALDIIVLKDTGAGGDIFVKNINEYFEETHNIFIPEPLYDDDIADCDIETINKIMRNL